MPHEPALEAHEHAEHAEHAAHQHDPFISRVSMTVAALAVLAATVGSLETIEAGKAITASSEAVLSQDKATDVWDQYEAESLKKNMYAIAAGAGGPLSAKYAETSKEEGGKQGELKAKATDDEKERDALLSASRSHEDRHHWLTAAATLLEIAIAICTVAIITHKPAFWLGSLAMGAGGLILTAIAFLG